MYYKVGNISLAREGNSIDQFFIVSQVVNSNLSYEKPILVTSKEDLEIWFGEGYEDRDYFEELIDSNICLLLYKPISEENIKDPIDLIDLKKFKTSYRTDKLPDINNLPENYDTTVYIVNDTSYVWADLSIVDESKSPGTMGFVELPFVAGNYNPRESMSLLNRDTLEIRSIDSSIPYINPTYRPFDPITFSDDEISKHNNIYSKEESKTVKEDDDKPSLTTISRLGLDMERVEKEYQTYAFDFYWDDVDDGEIKNLDYEYLILPGVKDGVLGMTLFYRGNLDKFTEENPILSNEFNISYKEEIPEGKDRNEFLDNLKTSLKKFGYKFRDEDSLMYSNFPIDYLDFYNIPNLDLVPNIIETYNVLKALYKDDEFIMRFWSKTIGESDYDSRIKITLEGIPGSLLKRVRIERFGYVEVFEGALFDGASERLDYTISKKSKLVYCEINDNRLDDIYKLVYDKKMSMIGSFSEEALPGMYVRSLEQIKEQSEYDSDFLLVPNISDWVDLSDFPNSMKRVSDSIYEFNSSINNQSLIQFSYRIHLSYFNFLVDTDSRILKFFNGELLVNNSPRPGYYLLLKNIIDDTYKLNDDSVSCKKLSNFFKRELKLLNCNYLNFNNHEYFHENYYNPTSASMSLWLRFTMGKINRELQKNKGDIIGLKNINTIKSKISSIIDRISKSFSIIDFINIESFDFDLAHNKIGLVMSTKVKDTIEQDITIDFTINYK